MCDYLRVSTPRTVRTSFKATLRRRLVSLPITIVGFPVVVALTPLLAIVTLLVDLITAPRRFPLSRLLATVVGYWAYAFVAQFRIAWLWVRCGFGVRNWEEPNQERLRLLTQWWTQGLTAMFGFTVGARYEVTNVEALHDGPVIVLPRHVSLLDAMFSPSLVQQASHMAVRLVMTRGLRNEPSLDMVGHRAPHHFVARGGGDSVMEARAVGRLASDLGDSIAVVLYPEGGLSRPAVRERIIAKLSESDPEKAERARQLTHLLPVRPGGALELLRQAPPGTDVAMVGHVGFDQLTDPRTMWGQIPLRVPIRAHVFRYAAAEIPDADAEREKWLQHRWQELNDWVAHARAERDADVSSA